MVKKMSKEFIVQYYKKGEDKGPLLTEDAIKRMAKEMIAEYNKKTKDFH